MLMRAAIVLFVLLASSVVKAEEQGQHGGHEGGHDFHQNLIAMFLGVSSEDHREEAFTVGLEYERRVSASFGVGAVVERATGDLDFWVYAVPFAYHSGPWKLYAAPGIEDSDQHGSEFLFRVGLEYAFEVGSYEVSPQVDIDFVDGETVYVVGVTIGRGF
jgi:hypothetical protein